MSAGDWKDFYKAACTGDMALVKYHVDSGVDLDYAHPEFYSTPLVGAIRAGQDEVVLFLLARGASPNLVSAIDGVTPIQATRAAGRPRVEARLREMGVKSEPSRRRWRWPWGVRRRESQ